MIEEDTKKHEKEEKEKEREERLKNTIERLREDLVIPIGSLEGIRVGEKPLHLDSLETEIFRFFEVNRANAYTFRGFMWELMHPGSPSLCPQVELYIDGTLYHKCTEPYDHVPTLKSNIY